MPTPTPDAVLVKTTGAVYAERQGTRVSLAEGDAIFAADTIITDSSATADIRFRDGATARLSPETRLEVREFVYGDADPSFVLELAQGAMRSVSGEVVKQNPDAFRIVTPQATVGIRGTELYNAVLAGGKEVHAVLFVSNGHVVVVSTVDGRSITLDSSLQSVGLTRGDMGPLVIQQFSLSEMETVIQNLTPTLGKNLPDPTDPQIPGEGGNGASESLPTITTMLVVNLDGPDNAADVGTLRVILDQLGIDSFTTDLPLLGDTTGSSLRDEFAQGTVTSTDALLAQIFEAPAASGTADVVPAPEPAPTPPPAPDPYIHRAYADVAGTEGTDHLPGLDPTAAQEFTVTGTVSAPLVGNADSIIINLVGDVSTAPSSTAADVFSINTVNYPGNVIGDVNEIALPGGAPFVLGADTISVSNLNEGSVTGDSTEATVSSGPTVNPATVLPLTFGGDAISVGTMGGAGGSPSIFGDAETVKIGSYGKAAFGDDVIGVASLLNGNIYGDAKDVEIAPAPGSNPSIEAFFGNDVITIGAPATPAEGFTIYGDAETVTLKNENVTFGNDVITLDMVNSSDASQISFIYGDAFNVIDNGADIKGGNDTITVKDMNAASPLHIDGGYGEDTISVGITNGTVTLTGGPNYPTSGSPVKDTYTLTVNPNNAPTAHASFTITDFDSQDTVTLIGETGTPRYRHDGTTAIVAYDNVEVRLEGLYNGMQSPLEVFEGLKKGGQLIDFS